MYVGKVVSRNLTRKTKSCKGSHLGACIRLATSAEVKSQVGIVGGKLQKSRVVKTPSSLTAPRPVEEHITPTTRKRRKKLVKTRKPKNSGTGAIRIVVLDESDEDLTVSPGDDLSRFFLATEEQKNVRCLHLQSRQLEMLENTNLYVDDTVIQAANILLKDTFPAVRGFEDTLFQQKPQLRSKWHPTAANIFHLGSAKHYVVTVYASPNVVVYMDSLKPGGKPCDAVIKQVKDSYMLSGDSFVVKSLHVQKQTHVDCGPFSVGNMWAFVKGEAPETLQFREDRIRSELYTSFKTLKLRFSFRKCKPRRAPKLYYYKLE